MKYYLGIDGGGTKTSFIVIDENENVVSKTTGGPSSIDTVGLEKCLEVITENSKGFDFSGIFAGIGGIASRNDSEKIENYLKKLFPNTPIRVENDIVNACYGALGGKDGMVIIAGTGSVMYGKNKDKTHRCGGYGYQEGDAGSSYDLGHRAIQHLARVIDGRLPEDDLSKAIAKAINCNTYAQLCNFLVNGSRTEIANLAKIVTECDQIESAKKIIIEGVDEIILGLKAVYNILKFDNDIPFGIIGSLGNAETLYKRHLLQKLSDFSKKIYFIENVYSADYASALIAKRGL